jgi:hypothetical protein
MTRSSTVRMNLRQLLTGEVRRILLPRTPVNKAWPRASLDLFPTSYRLCSDCALFSDASSSASAHRSRASASRSDLDHLRVWRASPKTIADRSPRSQVPTDVLRRSRIAEARLTSG